ncbi:unnamed protein product, partial [Prorocentrum cordatum]
PMGRALLTRLAFQLKLRIIDRRAARPPPAGAGDAAAWAIATAPSSPAPSTPSVPARSRFGIAGAIAPLAARRRAARTERRLDDARRTVRTLQKRPARQHATVGRLQRRIEQLEGGVGDPLAISKVGSHQLSWSPTVAMGLRRNLSTISAADFGAVTLLGVSRQTVCRSERLVGSCIAATSRQFFESWRLALPSFLRSSAPPDPQSIVDVYSWRQDATNSGVWRRQKVAALEAEAFVMLNPLPRTSTRTCQMCEVSSYVWRLSDIQTVSLLGCTGEFTHRLVVKQLKALGVHVWEECGTNVAYDACARACLTTTDQGSGQIKARRIIAILTAPMPNVIFFDHSCLERVVHLIIGQALKLADRFLKEWARSLRCYSTVAICANVWRDAARPIYLWWIDACGPTDAKARASKLCPKLQRLLLHSSQFSRQAWALVGDLSADSASAWTAMLGRWRKQAELTTSDLLFWGMLKCNLWSRSVTTHASCFLKSKGRQHLAELACGKAATAASLFGEYDELLNSHPWQDLFGSMSEDDSIKLNSFAIANLMVHAGGFWRRVDEPAVAWPYRMFGLIFGGDQLQDALLRRQTARDLLETDPLDIDIGARKLRAAFTRDIQVAELCGRVSDASLAAMRNDAPRWSPLPAADGPLIDPTINMASVLCGLYPDMRVNARRAWSVAHNAVFSQIWKLQPAGMSLCFGFGESPQHGCPLWVSVERHRSRHVFCQLTFDEPSMCAHLVRPLSVIRSVRLFDAFCEAVSLSDAPVVMKCFRLTWGRRAMQTAPLSALDDVSLVFRKL